MKRNWRNSRAGATYYGADLVDDYVAKYNVSFDYLVNHLGMLLNSDLKPILEGHTDAIFRPTGLFQVRQGSADTEPGAGISCRQEQDARFVQLFMLLTKFQRCHIDWISQDWVSQAALLATKGYQFSMEGNRQHAVAVQTNVSIEKFRSLSNFYAGMEAYTLMQEPYSRQATWAYLSGLGDHGGNVVDLCTAELTKFADSVLLLRIDPKTLPMLLELYTLGYNSSRGARA